MRCQSGRWTALIAVAVAVSFPVVAGCKSGSNLVSLPKMPSFNPVSWGKKEAADAELAKKEAEQLPRPSSVAMAGPNTAALESAGPVRGKRVVFTTLHRRDTRERPRGVKDLADPPRAMTIRHLAGLTQTITAAAGTVTSTEAAAPLPVARWIQVPANSVPTPPSPRGPTTVSPPPGAMIAEVPDQSRDEVRHRRAM